ncbi:flagellar hook-length control protein FliK [Mangrovitalea sediminis]|uniref:flagellar hook-length control protein FliK n=1 Tax=Mangrovitalea sediminis TaxID=1982043 RepID=UPI00130433F2|nr:flagellar hook-length control protein FliK [Mangrovitalea sediminis]
MKVTPPPASTPPQETSRTPAQTVEASPESGQQQPAKTAVALLDSSKLQPGQTAVAQVLQTLASADGGSTGSRILLALQGQSVPVESDVSLQPGQWVKVERTGNQLRLMELITPDGQSTSGADRLAQALAQRLPFQQRLDSGLRQLLQTLASLTSDTETKATLAPTAAMADKASVAPTKAASPLTAALQKLVEQLPTQTKLSQLASQPDAAAQVKQLLRNSGLFSEARLAAALTQGQGAPLPADFKLLLTDVMNRLVDIANAGGQKPAAGQAGLAQASVSDDLVQAPLRFPLMLTPLPQAASNTDQKQQLDTGALLKLVAGMLNRIAVTQLHTQNLNMQSTPDSPAQQTWLIEVPWLAAPTDPRTAQLRLERREREEGQKDKPTRRMVQWHLNLALDLDGLGPVYFEIALRQRRLDAHIWAEKDHAVHVIRRESDGLRQRFTELGLDVAQIECHRGQPRQAKTQLAQRLVDIKA